MAFKKPAATSAVSESPDRLFMDLPKRRHPSLFDHQGCQPLRFLQHVQAPDRIPAFVLPSRTAQADAGSASRADLSIQCDRAPARGVVREPGRAEIHGLNAGLPTPIVGFRALLDGRLGAFTVRFRAQT